LDWAGVFTAGVVVKLSWAAHAQSFMRALKIELMAPKIKGFLAEVEVSAFSCAGRFLA